MSSTILVVGGAGYVGSHVVLELLQKDWNVSVIDKMESCCCNKPEILLKIENFIGKEINYYNCDMRDKDSLSEIFESDDINCVIHLASLKNSAKHPLELYQNDVVGTLCLLETMKQYGVKNIVFSSTVYVYGEPDVLPITEEHNTGYKLPDTFSKSKHMIEEALKDLCKSDNTWAVIILRHVSPAGALISSAVKEKLLKHHVVFIAGQITFGQEQICICRKEYESVYEAGMCDYLHICDVATAYVLATSKTLSSQKGFKVYNLSSGTPHTIVDVLEAMSVVSGKPIKYEIVEKGTAEPGFYVSGELAQNELGWKAKRNINDICKDTYTWIKTNAFNLRAIFGKSNSFIE